MAANITMITSGKGGTGKSTVAVYLCAQLAARGRRTLLVELDGGLRSVDIISGVYGSTLWDIGDVFAGACESEQALVKAPGVPGLSIVSAPVSGGRIDAQALRRFCSEMAGRFDEIVLDTAAGLGDAFMAAAQAAGTAILVVTADPVALRDARIASDILYEGGMRRLRLVINRLQPERLRRLGIRDLDECIDRVAARLLGVIPESDTIALCAAGGQPLPPNSREHEIFSRMASRLLGQDMPILVDG